MLEGNFSDDELRRYVQKQKAAIKKTQEKLETAKKQYRADKKLYLDDDFRQNNPEEYLRQKKVLDDVKVQIEKRIEVMNEKVEQVKSLEKKIKHQ